MSDSYMNLQLATTQEYIDGQFSGNLGEILIRKCQYDALFKKIDDLSQAEVDVLP